MNTIYLDIDGVLADFTQAANRIHGRYDEPDPTQWDWYRVWGLSENQFWDKINRLGDGFYRHNVKPYSYADALVFALVSFKLFETPTTELIVATSNSRNQGYNGKVDFIRSLVPKVHADIVFIDDKSLLAKSSDRTILIDDNSTNCQKFKSAGGSAFLWPQKWNGPLSASKSTIPDLVKTLHTWKNSDENALYLADQYKRDLV